jgi:hypothetical protein
MSNILRSLSKNLRAASRGGLHVPSFHSLESADERRMKLSFRDRVGLSLLCGLTAAGFVLVGARHLGWPRPAMAVAMTAAVLAVVGALARWARRADDFDDLE